MGSGHKTNETAVDGHDRNSTIRYALAGLMMGVPLVLAVVYGIVRDVPPSTSCGETDTGQGLVDDYRAGVWWLVAVAELVALAVLVAALRARRGGGWPERLVVAAVAGALGVAAGIGLALTVDLEDGGPALIVGLGVVGGAGWLLSRAAGETRPKHASVTIAVTTVALLASCWFLLLIAVYLTEVFLPVLGFATMGVLAWLASRLGRGETAAWRALAVAAAFVAVLLIPGEAVVIVSRGHGPIGC